MKLIQKNLLDIKSVSILPKQVFKEIHNGMMNSVSIFPFVVDRVIYLILAGENNHYGGISLNGSSLSREQHWKE